MAVPRLSEASAGLDRTLKPGERVSDRYIIEARVGRGGMGTVYRAHDTLLNELVALKFLHPGLLRTQRGQQLFIQEAQICRRLRHEHIVAVHDVACTPEGVLYLSMEFVHGQSLRAFLRRRRTERKLLDVRLAVNILSQVLDALEYAHRLVVHRDMKPENVMLMPGERVKVLDFGLAKAIEADTEDPEVPEDRSRVIGTAAYAAPEQKRHQGVDLRADIFTAGLLLYELLTLRTPVDRPVPVGEVRNDVSPDLLAVLEKARHPDRENRWQSADEFRRHLIRAFKEAYRPQAAPAILRGAGREASTEDMVYLEGGSFLMGNDEVPEEAPEVETYVEPFYLDKYPVTNRQYAEFLAETGYPEPKFWRNPQYNGPLQPVVGVSWADAGAYAAWAGKRLPTEREWEFAARGRENRRYPWGHQEPSSMRSNYGDFLNMPSIVTMHEEGRTPEGIHDLGGNVYEWTGDLYAPYDPAKREAVLKSAPPRRVVRGGSWHSPASELRCTFRKAMFPDVQLDTVGFRCCVPASNGRA